MFSVIYKAWGLGCPQQAKRAAAGGYHIGASLKDAGKKCFGINLIQDAGIIKDILQRLELETEK